MRIVVNDIAASSGGALSVLQEFYTVIRENDKENEYIFLLSEAYVEETDNIKVVLLPQIKQSKIRKIVFDLWTGKKFVNRLKPDVVFSLQNIITFGLKVPQVVYVHQSLPFQTYKRFSFVKKTERGLALIQYGIGFMIKRSIKKAQRVIVQTNWMKQAIVKQVGVSEKKVYQIEPNIKSILELQRTVKLNTKQFFYPTTEPVYKNNQLILEACELLKADGISEYEVEMTLDKINTTLPTIKTIGRISREAVWKKYTNSTLIFPSYIETYGMPLAEAKMLGTLILAADCNYAREVLEGYDNAYFFDYQNPGQLAELMKKVLRGQLAPKLLKQQEQMTERNNWLKVRDVVIGAKENY